MEVVNKVTASSAPSITTATRDTAPEPPVVLSLEARRAYLRRRRRPDWWFWLLTTVGVLAMLVWLVAEAIGLFQAA